MYNVNRSSYKVPNYHESPVKHRQEFDFKICKNAIETLDMFVYLKHKFLSSASTMIQCILIEGAG